VTDSNAEPILAMLLESLVQTASAAGPTQPSPELRQNLLAATAPAYGAEPFPGYRRRFAKLFDLGEAAAARVLARMSDPAVWEPLKTLSVHHFDPGPGRPNAHAGLVRIAPGVPFPVHRHIGTETTLFLSGSVRDDDTGAVYLPGDLAVLPGDTVHHLTVLPPRECVFAVLLEGGMPDFDSYG
jgi:quercetin dioxygenase-like cupin family protein